MTKKDFPVNGCEPGDRFVVSSELVVEVHNVHQLTAAALASLDGVARSTPEGLGWMRARIEDDPAVALDFLTDPAAAIAHAKGVHTHSRRVRVGVHRPDDDAFGC